MKDSASGSVAKVVILLSVMTTASEAVHAGAITFWQLDDEAKAPRIVVGRVLDVQKGERVLEGTVSWDAETLAMSAEIQVLRAYPAFAEGATPERLNVLFMAYGPSVTMFINGYPPALPRIESGQVLILPLKENKNPPSDSWQLTANSGVDLTIPVRADMTDSDRPAASARAFLEREVVDTLSRGTPSEVAAIAQYLEHQHQDLTGELMPLLTSDIGDNRDRWAEVATNLIAAEGTPRPSVADRLANEVHPKDWPGRGSILLAQAVLQKLKPAPGSGEQADEQMDALLIKDWIAEAPLHAWGSANSLLEFGDNPVTTELLRKALRDDIAGTSYIAFTLIRNDNRETLPDALARALKVVDRPDADPTDLQGAAALLRDFGNDQQLKQLATVVRKYQTQDEKFYSSLWQSATESDNPREARVLAVVLRDQRISFGDTRYCDYAVGVLERAVGQHFGGGGGTLEERDAAVKRAQAWLATQGITE